MVMLEYRVNGLGFMDASTCIYMYCNIERNIMKNQFGSPGFGIQGKYLCIYFLFFAMYIFMS